MGIIYILCLLILVQTFLLICKNSKGTKEEIKMKDREIALKIITGAGSFIIIYIIARNYLISI